MTGAYHQAVVDYHRAGWPCILPVPAETKSPPPEGFTGADGRDTGVEDLAALIQRHTDSAIALRLPDGVIGIDVDHYTKTSTRPDGTTHTVVKDGADQLAALIERWGPLPPTWISTARGTEHAAGPSGIRFFRVPPGRYRTKLGNSIEVIQRHHRYAVVAPSPHAAAGALYRWYAPNGRASETVPKPEEFPELPAAWVAGLAEGATAAGPSSAGVADGQRLLDALAGDHRPICAELAEAASRARELVTAADEGSRHDTMTERTHHVVQLSAWGHPGAGPVLADLEALWAELTAGENRAEEFTRMLLTSARKAVTAIASNTPVTHDPCIYERGLVIAAPVPTDDRPSSYEDGTGEGHDGAEHADGWSVDEPVGPAAVWHLRGVIGAHLFDPPGMLDQTLAEAVLERTYPALRYAVDAGAWLRAGPYVWETHKDLTGWAVAELATLMPLGDPNAEQGTPLHQQAARRAGFFTQARSNAIGGKMKALTSGGTHPCSVRLAELDAERFILWAGGVPWDLRLSTSAPTPAGGLHPATPHLHSASVCPATIDTPRWDAFLATVWPDEELRRWALRVLGITLTGYPDAALPILLGPTRRGKSQVIALLMSLLGTYAHAADPRLLGAADTAHASIVYALKGRRLSFIDEGPREGRWAQERLKQLTGGTELTGNRMHENPVTFSPTHTLVLTANDEPTLTDPAIRARVRLLPCEGDPEAVAAARAAIGEVTGSVWRREAPGVLAAMMAEAGLWLADRSTGLTAAGPESVRYLAETVAHEQDPIARWLEDACVPDEVGTRSRVLYEAFIEWCRKGRVRDSLTPSETKWGRELTNRGFSTVHRRDGWYRPLRLRFEGGWGFGPDPKPEAAAGVTGSPADVTGRDGSEENPSQPQNTRSTPVSYSSVTGVTGKHIGNAHAQAQAHTYAPAHTHTHKQYLWDDPSHPSPEGAKTGVDQGIPPSDELAGTHHGDPSLEPAKTAPDQGISDVTGNPSRDSGPTEPDKDETKPKTKAELRKEAKAAEQAAKLAEAAGDVLELPAVVARSGDIVPTTIAAAADTVRHCMAYDAGTLTVDIETTGYVPGHAAFRVRTVQLGNDQLAAVFDAADTAQLEAAAALLAEAKTLQAHSATADLIPLAHAGVLDLAAAWERMHDTVIPAKLADPASTGSDEAGLKKLAAGMLGAAAVAPAADAARAALFKVGRWLTDVELTTDPARSGWAQVNHHCATMIRYAASDVLDTAAIAKRLPDPDPALADRERAAQLITARVTDRGVRLDGDRVRTLTDEHTPARETAREKAQALGVDNPGSPKQVAARLTALGIALPLTDAGQPSVAKRVLDQVQATLELDGQTDAEAYALATTVLDYRHHNTVLGLFLEPYRQLVEFGDGRARPTVYTLGTDTGRMSCARPNLQQLPREGGVRACITADPGYRLISADFSGVEVRVAAALSGDPTLRQMFADGLDLHDVIAAAVFGPDFTKANRYMIKRGVFGHMYGGSPETLAAQVGVPVALMAEAIRIMQQLLPVYTAWSDRTRQGVRAGRIQFPTYAGRVIHLDKREPHKAANYCIQGTARELLVDALIRWRETRWGDCTLFPVHDEIVGFVPEAEADAATAELVRCMSNELNGITIKADPRPPSIAWEDAS